jgi:hypothetical protein
MQIRKMVPFALFYPYRCTLRIFISYDEEAAQTPGRLTSSAIGLIILSHFPAY